MEPVWRCNAPSSSIHTANMLPRQVRSSQTVVSYSADMRVGRVLLRLSTQAPNNLSTVEMLCLANTDPMQQEREREMTNSQVTEGPSQPQQHNNEKNMLHINWRVLRIEPDICGKGKKKWTVGKRESGNNGRLGLWWDLVHVVPRTAWFYYIWRCA